MELGVVGDDLIVTLKYVFLVGSITTSSSRDSSVDDLALDSLPK